MIAARYALFLFASMLLGGLASAFANAAPVRLVLAHAELPSSISAIAANEFARRLTVKLHGRYEIVVKGRESFDNEEALLDLVEKDKIAFCLLYEPLFKKIPALKAFKLPYLVLTRGHIQEIRDTLLKTYLRPEAQGNGFEMLAMWDNGFRYITSNVPFAAAAKTKAPARVAPGSWEAENLRKMGFTVKEVPDQLVYEALKNKEVAGQASSLAVIADRHYYEVQKYLYSSSHNFLPAFLIASRHYLSSLDREAQRATASVAKELEDWSLRTGEAEEAKMIAELGTKMTVEEMDRVGFLIHSFPVYRDFAKANPGSRAVVQLLYDQSATGGLPLSLN